MIIELKVCKYLNCNKPVRSPYNYCQKHSSIVVRAIGAETYCYHYSLYLATLEKKGKENYENID